MKKFLSFAFLAAALATTESSAAVSAEPAAAPSAPTVSIPPSTPVQSISPKAGKPKHKRAHRHHKRSSEKKPEAK